MHKCDENERAILLSFASRVDRNDPGALNNLGVVYYRKGMYQEAIEQFKEAVKLDSKFDLARENLRYVYVATNMIDADVQNWSARLEGDPKNIEFLSNLGASYYNVGRLDEAAEILGRAVELDPSHYLARMRLGNVLKAKGRYREALDHYLFVEKEVGRHPVYYTDLGEIYYNVGRTRDAITALKTAIEIDSGYWRPHFLLSFAHGDEGMPDEAARESAIASDLNPYFQNAEANLSLLEENNPSHRSSGVYEAEAENGQECTSYLLGVAYKERGYMKEALAEFELALIEAPDNEHLHAEIAQLYLLQGDFERASTHLLKTFDKDPENAATCKILGSEHHINANLEDASAFYLEAYRLDSADPDVMNNLGVLLYQTGLREDAERMFKKALNRDPYHVQTNTNVFVNYMLKEDYPMAENALQHYEKFASETPQFLEKRALLQFKMGRLNAAVKDIEKALDADGGRSDALFLKGMVYLREDNLKKAVQSIMEASKISKRFTGIDLLLACEHRESGEVAVASEVAGDPSEAMIELLQASTTQGFEEVGSVLEVALKKAVENTAVAAVGHVDSKRENCGARKGKDAKRSEEAAGTGFEALNSMIEELKSL